MWVSWAQKNILSNPPRIQHEIYSTSDWLGTSPENLWWIRTLVWECYECQEPRIPLKPPALPHLSRDLLYRNGMRSTKSWTSRLFRPSSYKSLPTASPSQLHTPELSYIPSRHWKLPIWCHTPIHSPIIWTCSWTHCSDHLLWQEWCSTHIPSRRFLLHAESCSTPLGTSDPDSSIASVRDSGCTGCDGQKHLI
jgi:hypothetical protein